MDDSSPHRNKRRQSTLLRLESLEQRQMLTVVTFLPTQDTTIFEDSSNAYGAGPDMFVGNTNFNNTGRARRGLLQFDLNEQIPPGSVIYDVSLQLTVTKTSAGPEAISLQPLLAAWGEGSSPGSADPNKGGSGTPVTANSATWQHRRYSDELWSSPGGDYSPDVSASTVVDDLGSYVWQSDEMLTDLEDWLASPESNFGWILTGNETGPKTTKRFGSRENADASVRPTLTVDFDPPILPLVSIEGTSGVEGDVNLNSYDFQVTLSDFSPTPITVSYQTTSDTATADEDFVPTSGQVVFRPGEPLTQNISVFVIGDVFDEDDEQFLVELTKIDGPAEFIGVSEAAGTINDDDPLPTIATEDVSVLEGEDGTSEVELTVTLSELSGREVTVQYETAAETAEPEIDYQPGSGQITFEPGEKSKTIRLLVNGDVDIEADETFIVTLSSPENADLDDADFAVVTIQNDDFPPTSPWQNKIQPEDVDNDGFVVPLDALLVINELNNNGARALPVPPEEPNVPPPFFDVNGDDFVAPLDALLIINYLNNRPVAAVAARSMFVASDSEPQSTFADAVDQIMPDNVVAAALADLDRFDPFEESADEQSAAKRRRLI